MNSIKTLKASSRVILNLEINILNNSFVILDSRFISLCKKASFRALVTGIVSIDSVLLNNTNASSVFLVFSMTYALKISFVNLSCVRSS